MRWSSSVATTRPTRRPPRCSRSATDLSTLARVSYLAELRGNLDVALARDAPGRRIARPGAREHRVRRGAPRQPARLHGRPGAARPTRTTRALELVPAHAPSLAGQARLAVGAGDLDDGDRAASSGPPQIVPLPEYVIALGDAQTAAGRPDGCRRGASRWPGPRSSCSRRAAWSSTSTSPCSRPTMAIPARALEFARRPTRRRRPSGPPTPSPGRSIGWAATTRPGPTSTKRSGSVARSAAALPRRGDRGRPRRHAIGPPRPRARAGHRPGLLGDRRRRGPSPAGWPAALSDAR